MSAPQPKAKTPQTKLLHSISFRIERRSTYVWQGYKVTTYTDGSYIEEISGKEDLVEIVLRKIGIELKDVGQREYLNQIKVVPL